MTVAGGFDIDAVMAEIHAEVERRRAAGDYDEALLQAIHEEFTFDPSEPPEATAYIAAVRPIASTRPVIGPVIVFVKRVVRRLVAWYVAPIADDQTRHNVASIHLVRSLERRITAIDHALAPAGQQGRRAGGADSAAVEELGARVAELERQVATLAAASPGRSQPASSSDTE